MPIPNQHKVPKKQWNKWSKQARNLFNSLYENVRENQELFRHPKAPEVEEKHWKTVAWNVAWIAADYAVDIYEKEED